jgi:hypothetical protein
VRRVLKVHWVESFNVIPANVKRSRESWQAGDRRGQQQKLLIQRVCYYFMRMRVAAVRVTS